ncbi:hypothetical protein PybrP1_001247 [[Pythium] brassicae (nom. inval.)]|nr:hypothetical protein PybrP1_001247 [[Pythium] brassicae (nom. inval.)]
MPPSDEEPVLVEAMTPTSPPTSAGTTPATSVETEEESTTKKTSVTVVTTTTTASSSSSAATAATASTNAALFSGYEQWVKAHTGLARNIETMLYIAPQFVPKTAVPPEVATQAGYSLVGLLHLYHDYVLYKAGRSADAKPPNAIEQFTRMLRVPLSLITHTQVLSEVLAGKIGGEAVKWRVIVWIEVVKSVLRLLLLVQTRKSLLIKGGKEEPVPEQPAASKAPNSVTFDDPAVVIRHVPRENLLLGGEVLHILRPVAYALLRLRRSEESWTPVAVSLLVEVAGLWLSNAALKPVDADASSAAKPSEKVQAELASRKMALLLYFLRDPVYVSVTQPATGKVCDVLDYVPVAGRAVRFASTAVMNYYHQFHFYTSAS